MISCKRLVSWITAHSRSSVVLLLVACAIAFVVPAGTAYAAPRLTPVTTAVEPVFLTHAGDSRLFVVERRGVVRIFSPSSGAFLAAPFLDLTSQVSLGGERGLLSIAFHPDYAANRYFYVYYTNAQGNVVVERYRTSANPDVADPASAARLLTIDHTQFGNHNGGQLQVGPLDGHLYVGTGDGGGGGDPLCNGQNMTSLLGKLLRLDIRTNLTVSPYYGIPSDNPFRTPTTDPTGTIRDEIWASGLRNPWRFSFDRATGDLYIADVGQGAWEEVDKVGAGSAGGQDFGWNAMEGNHCYSTSCGTSCTDPSLTPASYEYGHTGGDCSITGGYFYRGGRVSELSGRYVFTDYCTGSLRTLRSTPSGLVADALLAAGGGVVSFGEDFSGEIYVLRGNQISRIDSDLPVVPSLNAHGAWILLFALSCLWVRHTRRVGREASQRELPV